MDIREWARATAVAFLAVISGFIMGALLMAGEDGMAWATFGLRGLIVFGCVAVAIVRYMTDRAAGQQAAGQEGGAGDGE